MLTFQNKCEQYRYHYHLRVQMASSAKLDSQACDIRIIIAHCVVVRGEGERPRGSPYLSVQQLIQDVPWDFPGVGKESIARDHL